ncbi:MAG: hypothetical protein QG554_1378 [Pseudomonadota bacterium]|nr:hypothetical protein [Pseudomonadota bacterium]
MNSVRWSAALCVLMALTACDRKTEPGAGSASSVASTVPAASSASVRPSPVGLDVGGVKTVQVTTSGQGATSAEAIDEAIRQAILQVNGVAMSSNAARYRMASQVVAGANSLSIESDGFAQAMVQQSEGVLTSFRVLSLSEPSSGASDAAAGKKQFTATIEASVAKFEAPAQAGKLKIVIGPIRTASGSYQVGDRTLSAEQVRETIRQDLMAALGNSGRFIVLDRDVDDALQSEMDLIADGHAPTAELAKRGQAMTADVVWVGTINQFAYTPHTRHLETSDRPLVSYSGGWSLSHKLVNVATRQVLLSDTLQGQLPATAPTTLSRGVNGAQLASEMRQTLASSALRSLLLRTFPITIASRDGHNVILSQGGQSVAAGARYQAVVLGPEVKDPQTGQSLGRVENACCEVVIDKVLPTMSQAHLENIQIKLDGLQPGDIQLRELSTRSASAASPTPASAPRDETPRKAKGSAGAKTSRAQATAPGADPVRRYENDW